MIEVKTSVVTFIEECSSIQKYTIVSPDNCCSSSCHVTPGEEDLVTTFSDTDTSSISTVSSEEEYETIVTIRPLNQAVPRSIFGDYWKVKGGAACLRRAYTRPNVITCNNPEPHKNLGLYEETLRENEERQSKSTVSSCSPCHRRRIFDRSSTTQSEPVLNLIHMKDHHEVRKIWSTTVLDRKPGRSCLRRSKFSGDYKQKDSDSCKKCSVSFKTEVRIVVFDNAKEFYIQEGWSDYFL